MFVVDDILISDEVAEAHFTCDLGGCLGACCVQGEEGAPLLPEERGILQNLLPIIEPRLRPEARAVIQREGVWEEVVPDRYATTCVDGSECVFVYYEGPIAKCTIQKAYQEGEVDWPKPVSCHLYPIRARRYGTQEVLNYEKWEICAPGRNCGKKTGIYLSDYLADPLVRKYGDIWYQHFKQAAEMRRLELAQKTL
ncbi:MAG TPA: DUF3109 family protein [Rhodothermales bacterium]|nr:DUF3109 family protein [Rhodothermales bacterium]